MDKPPQHHAIIWDVPPRPGYNDLPLLNFIRVKKLKEILNSIPDDAWLTSNGTTGMFNVWEGEFAATLMTYGDEKEKASNYHGTGYIDFSEGEFLRYEDVEPSAPEILKGPPSTVHPRNAEW